jgi:hypothetical protein
MWECYNCSFQNVDAAPVCVKCRARKPLPGEVPQRRSYHASEQASQERLADQVMEKIIPSPPTYKQIYEKWGESTATPQALREELAVLDHHVYAVRDALKTLINIIKNPQVRGRDELIHNAVSTLINWDPEK